MSLPWVRLDTQFPHNPKILELVEDRAYRAAFVYVCALSYVGGQGTDGYLPRLALPLVHGTRKDAEALVAVGLWIPNPTGWDINGWDDKQATSQEHFDRKARAKAAAMKRWHPDQEGESDAS